MLRKNKLYIIGFVLSILMVLQGCDKTWNDHYNKLDETTQKAKIITELEKIPEISKFTEAVKKIDTLIFILNQNRLFTVFAPVNEAFENIDPKILNNDKQLTRLILNHFIDGKYKYKDFVSEKVKNFNDKNLIISVDGSRKVSIENNATIIETDFLSKNGMIQVIDKTLIPFDNLYEYFENNEQAKLFANAISAYTNKEFLLSESNVIDEDKNTGELIYDSVFFITNPYLYTGEERGTEYMYNLTVNYVNITNENDFFTFVFPTNFQDAIDDAKSSPFLNNTIADKDWAGPIITNFLLHFKHSKEDIISGDAFRLTPNPDTSAIRFYFADLLNNNYQESSTVSNGVVYKVDGFKYDLSWLISDQGHNKLRDLKFIYTLYDKVTTSKNVDSAYVKLKNINTTFYENDVNEGYESKYGEWVNFELDGEFYPVDYKVFTRGINLASGTFKVEADGKDIGEYNFSQSPSGLSDAKFDEIGTVSFTETKSTTNLKFTFVKTHPDAKNTKQQYLWIREIMFSPIIK